MLPGEEVPSVHDGAKHKLHREQDAKGKLDATEHGGCIGRRHMPSLPISLDAQARCVQNNKRARDVIELWSCHKGAKPAVQVLPGKGPFAGNPWWPDRVVEDLVRIRERLRGFHPCIPDKCVAFVAVTSLANLVLSRWPVWLDGGPLCGRHAVWPVGRHTGAFDPNLWIGCRVRRHVCDVPQVCCSTLDGRPPAARLFAARPRHRRQQRFCLSVPINAFLLSWGERHDVR
mmetsp:Transcript_134477/g.335447  ORF Transcript_134477/g.335447 Transcript_134477/m.335447 type:complete len:230 (-) Transcript_134477:313-1002(-)